MTAKLWGICVSTPQRELQLPFPVQEQNTPAHPDVQSPAVSHSDTDSVSPLSQTLSLTCQQTHMRTDTTTHRGEIIFSLCCNASESLNRNCQQGKSPILQLCPQRDSGNCRNSTLYFLDFFSVALVTESAGHSGRKR